MKVLLSILSLSLFSQACTVIISQSNIHENFYIDSVEGVGCLAVPEKFKESLKSKLSSESAHGINIKEDFFEYIVKYFHLYDEERDVLYDLFTKEFFTTLTLVPFDCTIAMIDHATSIQNELMRENTKLSK